MPRGESRSASSSRPKGSLERKGAALLKRLAKLGQEHVFKWRLELTEPQRAAFIAQLEAIDLGELAGLMRLPEGISPHSDESQIVPPPYVKLPRTEKERRQAAAARSAGEDALRAGRIAIITVAGGQSARLRSDKPKGMISAAPITGKTPFQMHAEKILATSRRYGVVVPWAIMVSDATDNPTRVYFEQNRFFGLERENVIFFRQKTLPTLDFQRRLMLTEKDKIFQSPNGHGGTIRALWDEGVFAEFSRRGVQHVFYSQVDNPAVDIADPHFLGRHIQGQSEMSLKVMKRRNAEEKLGVLVMLAGLAVPGSKAQTESNLRVIEYSDLPQELKYARDEKGELKFPIGSPAIHIFDLQFLGRLAREGVQFPYHIARKPRPCLDESGNQIWPKEPNGFKFEMFIFDALRWAANPTLVEMDRVEEFAPIKNAEGEDSPETCRRILSEKYARWLELAGVKVPRDANGNLRAALEISPLFALDAEELARKAPKDIKVGDRLLLN